MYKDQNVFEEGYRHWIKEYCGFQTIPQLYIDKKFVGGLDVITKLDQEDKFMSMIPKGSIRDNPKDILDKI